MGVATGTGLTGTTAGAGATAADLAAGGGVAGSVGAFTGAFWTFGCIACNVGGRIVTGAYRGGNSRRGN